ncbi:MAG: replicative DNA helicase [Acidobacteriota bacterium]|jgi:replicative DNA helicase|nr:replicative DNA helicase [Acidobacteriota bacterium]
MADISLEKTLPSNLEAERAILGAILLDDKAVLTIFETLKAQDFYLESHRRIFEKMMHLTNESRPIDLVTLKDALQRASELESVGGAAYLASLTDGLPRAINIEFYAQIVKEKSTLRRLIQASNEMMSRSYQDEEPAQAVLQFAEKAIFDIAGQHFHTGFTPISPIVSDVFRQIEELSNKKAAVTGLETGFVDLDRMTAGLHPGDLIIVAARPSLGKTSLCLNIAEFAAIKNKKSVGIFSLEMSKEQLVKRLLCSESRIDAHRVNTGYLNKDDWNRLSRASGDLSETRIFIDDTASITIAELRTKARRLSLEHGLDLIIVDYLQLMSGSAQRYENRTQEISQISRGLKGVAKELGVPLIAVSQLSRAVESRTGEHRRPQLSDLRESGSIEQDADVVMFIYREDMTNPTEENMGKAELIIGKQRNGPTGSIELAFLKQFTRFDNLYQE